MLNREFKGVWIPKEIWLCKDLSALDRVIYAEIDSLDNENHCTADNNYFAEFCGVSVVTITRSIQRLIDLGYIEKVSFDGRHRILKVIKPTNQTDETDNSLIKMTMQPNQNDYADSSKCVSSLIKMTMQPNQNDYADSSKCVANNIYNNIDNNILNNTNNINIPESEESHCYSPEELKKDFLGSRQSNTNRKVIQKKKKNLYEKCVDEIYRYTKSIALQDELTKYLSVRLANKDKPLYSVNQWIGMLNKLSEISGESESDTKVDKRMIIVKQSIERGWCSFFEVKPQQLFSNRVGFGGELGEVSCRKATDEEDLIDANF